MTKLKSADKGVAALERSPSHLLHRALQVALDIYSEEFGPEAVTQRQYAVLAAAADHEGATQTGLVRVTGIDRSTLADMTARMVAKGLLERQRSADDGRANSVKLTPQGRSVLEAARAKMAAADARFLKMIPGGGRRDAFVGLLRDVIRSAEAATIKGEAPQKPGKKKKDKTAKRKGAADAVRDAAEGKKKKPKKAA